MSDLSRIADALERLADLTQQSLDIALKADKQRSDDAAQIMRTMRAVSSPFLPPEPTPEKPIQPPAWVKDLMQEPAAGLESAGGEINSVE